MRRDHRLEREEMERGSARTDLFHGTRRTLALINDDPAFRIVCVFVPCRPAVPSNSLPIIVMLQA